MPYACNGLPGGLDGEIVSIRVLTFLEPKSVVTLAMASKSCADAARDDFLWRVLSIRCWQAKLDGCRPDPSAATMKRWSEERGRWRAEFVAAVLDAKRTRISATELCSLHWEMTFEGDWFPVQLRAFRHFPCFSDAPDNVATFELFGRFRWRFVRPCKRILRGHEPKPDARDWSYHDVVAEGNGGDESDDADSDEDGAASPNAHESAERLVQVLGGQGQPASVARDPLSWGWLMLHPMVTYRTVPADTVERHFRSPAH